VARIIAVRELRNEIAKVIEAVTAGELRPLRAGRRSFLSRAEVAALARVEVRIDHHRFRADLDRSIDQGL
jgi:hypothetical protein